MGVHYKCRTTIVIKSTQVLEVTILRKIVIKHFGKLSKLLKQIFRLFQEFNTTSTYCRYLVYITRGEYLTRVPKANRYIYSMVCSPLNVPNGLKSSLPMRTKILL